MIPHRSRLFATGLIVLVAAFVLGHGMLFTEGPAPRSRGAEPPREPRRSGDDRGFSILLIDPDQPYLLGRQAIRIEPTVPTGDRIQQVDFFVDGRLLLTDRQAPYGTDFDFGEELQRHTIVVRALTAGGRRANVSFVSRSGDLSDRAAGRIVVVPTVVRDADGRPVEGLSVSDFTLLENGVRQPIVHFDSHPTPVSVAVAVQSLSRDGEARPVLLRGAFAFVESLPEYDAIGLFDTATDPSGEIARAAARSASEVIERATADAARFSGEAARIGAEAARGAAHASRGAPGAATRPPSWFSHDHPGFLDLLGEAGSGAMRPAHASLPEALVAAAAALRTRPPGRVALLLVAVDPEPFGPPVPEELRPAARAARGDSGDRIAGAPLTLPVALDEIRKAGAMLEVIAFGQGDTAGLGPLRRAAEDTGGDVRVATSDAELAEACRQAADGLRHRYLISYSPADDGRKGWRTLEVKVGRADLEVRARKDTYTE